MNGVPLKSNLTATQGGLPSVVKSIICRAKGRGFWLGSKSSMRAKQLPSGFFFFSSYNYPVEFLPTPLPSPAAKSDSYTNKDHTTAKKK